MTAILWVLLVWHPQTQLFVPVIWTRTELGCNIERKAFDQPTACVPAKQGTH